MEVNASVLELAHSPQSAVLGNEPSIAPQVWMVAMEERVERQATHTEELEARYGVRAPPARRQFNGPAPRLPPARHSVQLESHREIELFAAESCGHGEGDLSPKTQSICRVVAPSELSSQSAPSSGRISDSRQRRTCTPPHEETHGNSDSLDLASLSHPQARLNGSHISSGRTVVRYEGKEPWVADRIRPPDRGCGSSRPTADTCVALLDILLEAWEWSHTSPTTTVRDGISRPRRQRPASEEYKSMQPQSQQQNKLHILAKLRDALRELQSSYETVAGSGTHISLEAILQLPPETLLPVMIPGGGTPDAYPPPQGHPGSGPPRSAVWLELLSRNSLGTLWNALMDDVDAFHYVPRAAAETLWAAVLWMHACTTLTFPQQKSSTRHARRIKGVGSPRRYDQAKAKRSPCTAGSPSTLQRRPGQSDEVPEQLRPPLEGHQRWPAAHPRLSESTAKNQLKQEERWAYRVLPVCGECTAPTVYDDLFPLPTAVSPFVEPPRPTAISPPPSSSSWDEEGRSAATADSPIGKQTVALLHFYTGPARRPRSLV